MDDKKLNGCPVLRREELLDTARIATVLKSATQSNLYLIIDGLKQQAKDNGISLRDMNSIITQCKSELKQKSAPTISAPTDLPPIFSKADNFNACKYDISEAGIYTYIGENTIQVCPHPIFPYRILRDLQTREEQIQLIFYSNGEWRDDIIVSRSVISSGRAIVGLSKYGVMVNDENARYLIKYLCDIEMNNRDIIPAVYSVQQLGKTRLGYVPYCNDVIYIGENSDNKRRFNLFHEHGSFEKWRDNQNEICKYTIPKIVIAAGYASILLNEFGLNPFGVHLWGDTGKGKSVAIMASASIYGYPDIKNGIVYTGNATGNGLEARLSFMQDYCFYLDELSLLSAKQIDDMIMLIMQGQGKLRMTRTGEARESYYWNCVSVSNSEMPITNDFSKGGVYNRIIQIHPENTVFGDMDLPKLADELRENYGFGAKRFIEAIQSDKIRALLPEMRKAFYDEVIKHTEDKQANAASLLLTAYEIARMTIYQSENILTAADIIPFLHSSDEISQVMRVYDKFIDYVEANYKMFDDSDIGQTAQKWGKFIIRDGIKYVDIFPARLDDFFRNIVKEMPVSQFIDGLNDRNILNKPVKGNKITSRINGSIQKVFSIKIDCNYCNDYKVVTNGDFGQIEDENLKIIETDKLPFD